MPRHLTSDAHEWINEIPTVPIYYLAKPQPRERAWHNQRGKKTLLSLTLVRRSRVTHEVQTDNWEVVAFVVAIQEGSTSTLGVAQLTVLNED